MGIDGCVSRIKSPCLHNNLTPQQFAPGSRWYCQFLVASAQTVTTVSHISKPVYRLTDSCFLMTQKFYLCSPVSSDPITALNSSYNLLSTTGFFLASFNSSSPNPNWISIVVSLEFNFKYNAYFYSRTCIIFINKHLVTFLMKCFDHIFIKPQL